MRAATTVLILQWFVNIPLMMYFSRELEWGLEGIWAGKIIVTFLIMIAYILVLEFYDWELAIAESIERQAKEVDAQRQEVNEDLLAKENAIN
jgi:Na+-driven multidrug efflux pump